MLFLASQLPAWAILILLVGFFALIALVVFLVSKFVPGFNQKDEDAEIIDEKTRIQEELDRVLVPIEPEVEEKKDETSDIEHE